MTPEPGAGAADARPARDRVVFFGSGAFAVPILDALRSHRAVDVVGVVTAPDRPAGRGYRQRPTPVARRASELGLKLLQPVRLRDDETVAAISALRPRLGVLADYGRIVPQSILEIPERRFLNVHPSLLPRHRGASPIPAAILAGDLETGVSIIEMSAGIDDGPIVASERVALEADASAPELEARLSELGAALLERTIAPWLAGELPATPQDEAAATVTRPLRRADGRLDPRQPTIELERRVRAMAPWPGTFLETSFGRLSVDRASAMPAAAGDRAGTIVADDGGLALATVDGRLTLDEVRLSGARRMSGAELRRGRPALVGSRALDEAV